MRLSKAMKTRKQRIKRRGGAYVSEGSYGCGYYPALRCEGETVRRAGVFSKIVEQNEAESEYKIGTSLFKKIDPSQDYFLYPLNICKINKEVLPNPENNFKKCNVIKRYSVSESNSNNSNDSNNSNNSNELNNATIDRTLDDFRIIQYYSGGESLNKIKLTSTEYIPFFTAFENLFVGIEKLHKSDVVHMDIKPLNIVGQRIAKNVFHLRFIDFGLSIDLNDNKYKTSEIDKVYSNNYHIWPFYLRFVTGKFDLGKPNIKKFIDSIPQDIIRSVPLEVFYKKPNDYSTYLASIKEYDEVFDTIAKKIKLKELDRLKTTIFITKATDIYSLGLVLAEIYSKYTGHYYRFGGKMCINPQDTKIKIDFPELKDKVSPEVYKWHEEVFDKISIPIYNLVKGMLVYNPFEQMPLSKIISEYRAIVLEMRRLFRSEEVRKGFGIYFPRLNEQLKEEEPLPLVASPFIEEEQKVQLKNNNTNEITKQMTKIKLNNTNNIMYVPQRTRKRRTMKGKITQSGRVG